MSLTVKDNDSSLPIIKRLFSHNTLVSFLAVLLAVIVGGILICITDQGVQTALGYFFARPTDTFVAMWKAVIGAYGALLEGSIFNPHASSFSGMIQPLTETLTVSTPLILAGLGVTVAFRAGLFNIGAQGQIILGAVFATIAAIHLHLPLFLHLPLVIIFGAIGGALWGGIAGVLKAYTGAHEVIVTIMLNYIALNLVLFLLGLPFLQRPGASNPISPILPDSAIFPLLLGSKYRLNWSFVMAVLAVFAVNWLLNKSTLGFKLRAVGSNDEASETAGINVKTSFVIVMALAGALAGLAGVSQVSGTERVLTQGIAASFGFDAITVALLGRSTPWGTFFAGLLFGAFRAGGAAMQVSTGTPIDIVLVVQSLIVLFIAAPPLVRAIFRIKTPEEKALKAQKKVAKV
ncbi:MAG: ABC transporter permease [Micrococcaceae bacterium]